MTATSKTLASSSAAQYMRPFDPRRDMRPVADLVELCFADTLDESARNYLKRMRYAARHSGVLGWAAAKLELSGVPISGYVWEQDGKMIGNASMIPYYLKGRRYYLIANVAVHPDFRRRGIARALTNQAIDHARRRRSPSVWLHVRHENEAAVVLYQSLGFRERARRTTFLSNNAFTSEEQLPGVALKVSRSWTWSQHRDWLLESYPEEVAWHIPFNLRLLRPGIWGAMHRAIANTYVLGWSASSGGRLLGAVNWQSFHGPTDYLWLAFPPDANEEVVRTLLVHARRRIPSQRRIAVDFPANRFSRAIQEAGFQIGQTLMWMELAF